MRGLQDELGEIWPSFVLPGESVDGIAFLQAVLLGDSLRSSLFVSLFFGEGCGRTGFRQAVLPGDSLRCDRLISSPLVHRFFSF